jgi:monoamine oxidase
MTHDVLILGAGAAGLAAAAELTAAGRSVMLVEARDRVGGRAWSLRVPGLPVPIELGAEFIHGEQPATFEALRRTGLAAVDSPRTRWYMSNGKLVQNGMLRDQVRRAMRVTPVLEKRDMPFQQFLAGKRNLSTLVRAFARRMVEGYDAADPGRVSAREIAVEWTGESAIEMPQFRPHGGYGALMDRMLLLAGARADLRLETVVHAVRWRRGRVEVEGERRGWPFHARARRAIVTLPAGVLRRRPGQANAVRFEPALRAKEQALGYIESGAVLRVVMQYPRAFWEKLDGGRYRNASFFHSPYSAFPTVWTALPARAPLLVAWCGGPRAVSLSAAAPGDIVRRAAMSVDSLFGERAGSDALPVASWVHNWLRDRYAHGAYSYVTVGGSGARRKLAAPVRGTLYFAGEATDEAEAGTVAGALRSGQRAARELLADS